MNEIQYSSITFVLLLVLKWLIFLLSSMQILYQAFFSVIWYCAWNCRDCNHVQMTINYDMDIIMYFLNILRFYGRIFYLKLTNILEGPDLLKYLGARTLFVNPYVKCWVIQCFLFFPFTISALKSLYIWIFHCENNSLYLALL